MVYCLGTLHVLSHIIFQVIMEYLCYMKPRKLKLRGFWGLNHVLYFILFWPCGILVPQPGIKPMSPVLEAWSLNHWTTREVH